MQSARNLQRLKNSIQSCQRSLKSRKFTRGVSQGDCNASDVSFPHCSGADSRSLAVGLSHSCQLNKQCENNSFKLGRAIPMSADLSMSANLYGCYFQANTFRTNLFLVDRTSLSICKYFGNSVNVSLSNSSKPLTTVYRRSFCSIQKTAHGLELSSEEIGVQPGVANAKAEKSLNALGLISSLFSSKPGHPRKWFPWTWSPKPKGFHSSSASLNTARATPEISFDGPQKDESPEDSSNGSEQIFLGDRTLKLQSGACYLPHPEKEETGGEDAHFICVDEHAIGVADGVGGWALHGVNSGEYSRELMSKAAAAIQEEPKGAIDLLRVLEKAYIDTRAKGSSTACLLALMEKGLHAINLGDSGFLVVRDGCTVFRSPVQQHDFNFTYQLESGGNSDLPSSAEVFNIQVAPGDVIIAGTDGLFDNLYNNEVTGVVVHAVRAGLGPQVTAQKIAALARQRAQDSHRQTPFSTAAQEAGYRYYGGKLDDITVVVSYVCSSTANKAAE